MKRTLFYRVLRVKGKFWDLVADFDENGVIGRSGSRESQFGNGWRTSPIQRRSLAPSSTKFAWASARLMRSWSPWCAFIVLPRTDWAHFASTPSREGMEPAAKTRDGHAIHATGSTNGIPATVFSATLAAGSENRTLRERAQYQSRETRLSVLNELVRESRTSLPKTRRQGN